MPKERQESQRRFTTAVQPVSIFLLFLLTATLFFTPSLQAQTIDLFGGDPSPRGEGEEAFSIQIGDEDYSPESDGDADGDGDGDGDDDRETSTFLIDRGHSGSSPSAGSSIRLNYERRGSAILIPARVGNHDVYFMLDTGASYTTLTSSFAHLIGASPRPDAPSVIVQTAGGQRPAYFSMINQLTLGSQRLEHISFTVCDPCGGFVYKGRPVVGLLGLNVLRRFRISVDDSAGVVELQPHGEFDDRSADIDPWIQTELTDLSPRQGASDQFVVTLQLRNLSNRMIRGLQIQVECTTFSGASRSALTRPASLRPRGSAETSVTIEIGGCIHVEPRLLQARW